MYVFDREEYEAQEALAAQDIIEANNPLDILFDATVDYYAIADNEEEIK